MISRSALMKSKIYIQNKLFAFVVLSTIILFILLYLYNKNIIFVSYVEHGLVANKTDMGSSFKYDIYVDGELHFFITKDKSIEFYQGVVSFKHRKNIIVEFIGYVEPIKEKVMSRQESVIDYEYTGTLDVSDKRTIYRLSQDGVSVESMDSVIVGAENIKSYKDKKNKIRTILIDGDIKLNFIRIGIKNTGFQSFTHDKLEFISEGDVMVIDKKDDVKISIPPGTKITLVPSNEGISVFSDKGPQILKNRVYITPEDNNIPIQVLSFKRNYGFPYYGGYFEITRSPEGLKLINEIDFEGYLYKVVPSEMPSSFGLEALKAQAVAARTYAVSDLLSGRYAKDGFHVDDSTMSQVYNNTSENTLTTLAVNETKGLVMKYNGELVDAKYYSTSHGYGANSDEIWSSNGTFPGIKKPYFSPASYIIGAGHFNLSSEEDASEFFKDWSLKGFDSNSPYFRWKVKFTKEEIENTIEKNLPIIYKDQEDYILTFNGQEFESKPISEKTLGELKDMKVTRRGEGGNIMELVVSGTNGTYKILKELNVRYLIRPRKSDTGTGNDIIIKRIKGEDLKNSSLLPSAFMVFDIVRNSGGNISYITFYGGGYGHGVGMSQYGAGYLSSEGYTFDKILKTYYNGITIEKLY